MENEIEYVGEHLIPGEIGNLFIVIAFVGAILSFFSFFKATNSNDSSWKKLGQYAFITHGVAAIGIVVCLFYIIFNHYFEYYYVWQHSSSSLPLRYIFSCFWEGQEGSFLLWMIWHVVLGFILLITTGKWQAPVMAIFSLVQIFLGSMLLGITISDWFSIGSNPFGLLREHPDMANLPFIQNPEYVSLIEGRGLNPLLQNYWMTIHPPTLFFGFASTLIPFAYAVAGIWTKQYQEWIKPALPWTFFGIAILGTGVLMGGAWAYEALSFGGFWAWDPVENASLVPWITFVAGGHLMLVNKNRNSSLVATYIFIFLTFLLVLYSTYLTRSGILGETSVHSFAEGMPGQLIVFMSTFILMVAYLLIKNYKSIPKIRQEESLWSREFWMFIGALILGIAAFQISFSTSIPVTNKIFGTNMAPPEDAISHYNSWQIPFTIIVCLLIAFAQYLKYKNSDKQKFFKQIALSLIASVALTVVITIGMSFKNSLLIGLIFASSFTVMANLDYWLRVLKGKLKSAGPSVAHVGFGLLILGALLSTGKKQIISYNTSGININLEKNEENIDPNAQNIFLAKEDTLKMGEYYITYKNAKKEGVNIYYEVEYFKLNQDLKFDYQFTLYPSIQTNEMMGNVSEPSTKHFWNRDIFTHITYAEVDPTTGLENKKEEYSEPEVIKVGAKDTVALNSSIMYVKGINKEIDPVIYRLDSNDIGISLIIECINSKGKRFTLEPVMIIKGTQVFPIQVEDEELGLKLAIKRIIPEENSFELVVSEKKRSNFIIMQAIVFPYINVLWLGCIIMVIGSLLSVYYRIRKSNK